MADRADRADLPLTPAALDEHGRDRRLGTLESPWISEKFATSVLLINGLK